MIRYYWYVIVVNIKIILTDNDISCVIVTNIKTQMASSMEPMHLLVHDDQNEMQHDFFSHLTLLALASASYDATGIVNSTTVCI